MAKLIEPVSDIDSREAMSDLIELYRYLAI